MTTDRERAERLRRMVRAVSPHLIGLILEDKDADELLDDLEELRAQIIVRRRTARPDRLRTLTEDAPVAGLCVPPANVDPQP